MAIVIDDYAYEVFVAADLPIDLPEFIIWVANEYRDGAFQDRSEVELENGDHYKDAESSFSEAPNHFIAVYKGEAE